MSIRLAGVGRLSPLLEAVWPASCAVCLRPLPLRQRHGACLPCWSGLELVADRTVRERRVGALVRVVAGFAYDEAARRLLLRGKEGNRPELLEALGDQLAEVVVHAGLAPAVVVPVPSHPWSTWRRGFSPGELLARRVARRLGVRTSRLVVRRLSSPLRTKALGASERKTALLGAFRCRRSPETGPVLLVDDVLTTGASLSGCAAVLHAAGAASVAGAVWARVEGPGTFDRG